MDGGLCKPCSCCLSWWVASWNQRRLTCPAVLMARVTLRGLAAAWRLVWQPMLRLSATVTVVAKGCSLAWWAVSWEFFAALPLCTAAVHGSDLMIYLAAYAGAF